MQLLEHQGKTLLTETDAITSGRTGGGDTKAAVLRDSGATVIDIQGHLASAFRERGIEPSGDTPTSQARKPRAILSRSNNEQLRGTNQPGG